MKTKIASLIATAFVAGIAHAATTWYWTGKGNDANWFTAANWNSAADGSGSTPTDETPLASGDSFTFGSAIASATAINYNPSVDNFAIDTITFASGCGAVTVSGSDIASLGSVSNASASVQTFSNKANFSGNIKTINTSTGCVKYPGGAIGAILDTSTGFQTNLYGKFMLTTTGNWTANGHVLKTGSVLELPYGTLTNNLILAKNMTIDAGATGIVNKVNMTASSGIGIRCLHVLNGFFSVTNELVWSKNTAWGTLSYSGSGVAVVRKVTHTAANSGAGGFYPLRTSEAAIMVVGEGGIGNGGYCCVWNAAATYHFGSCADWEISRYDNRNTSKTAADAGIYHNGNNSGTRTLIFDTTDFYDNTIGRTITSYSPLKASNFPGLLHVIVEGIGTFAFRNTQVENTYMSGTLTATNTATISVYSGSRPWNAAVTMHSGTTLKIAESGTGTVNKSLTLKADSSLAFHFTSTETAPVLALNNTLSLPATGSVSVKVTADAGLNFNFGTKYEITSGGKFPADAVTSGKVVLSEGSVSWATLFVNASGNLAVVRKPYFTIKVR